ncbi:MAG: hypothetical protein WCT01_03955 [Candidatus Shapirobacteria bacterium]|jgi:hypothetical protein
MKQTIEVFDCSKVSNGLDWVRGRVGNLSILHDWNGPEVLGRLPYDVAAFIVTGTVADKMLVAAPPVVRVLGSLVVGVAGMVVCDGVIQTQSPTRKNKEDGQE